MSTLLDMTIRSGQSSVNEERFSKTNRCVLAKKKKFTATNENGTDFFKEKRLILLIFFFNLKLH